METHVKVLGILNIIGGVIGVFSALAMALIFGAVSTAVIADGDPDAAVAVPIIGLSGGALVFFLLLLSVPGIIVGIGLFRMRPWSRIPGIVLSVLSLMAIPIGTILGVYGLWVLLSKETEHLFARPQTA